MSQEPRASHPGSSPDSRGAGADSARAEGLSGLSGPGALDAPPSLEPAGDRLPPPPAAAPGGMRRRDFLGLAAGATLGLTLTQLRAASAWAGADGPGPAGSGATDAAGGPAPAAGPAAAPDYASWQDVYRNVWRWDRVTWGSHTNQCAPGGCSFRVYTRDGTVWREEQTAASAGVGPDYPDYNPQGCQKGCGFHHVLHGPERLLHPLKRLGPRGKGRWQRISWGQALGEIADAILDAHRTHGPESVIVDAPHIHAGSAALCGASRLTRQLGALMPDLNVGIGDDFKGLRQTFGKMQMGYTADNFFDAELVILTHCNVSYTWPATYHFLTEARYNGTEIVLLAPDYNATALTADIHVPVRVGSDAAFWLGVCQVILAEGLHQPDFVREQTDLALVVRRDNGRYLRASDLGEGSPEQLFFLDEERRTIAPAPRSTLRLEGTPALAGTVEVRLADGRRVAVSPALELLREKLDREYPPERASALCGVHADVIRTLARKVARRRTCCFIGFGSPKHYHGDLMERSLLLALGLTGNWGKPGTGFNCFLVPETGVGILAQLEEPLNRWTLWRLGLPFRLRSLWETLRDSGYSEEIAARDLMVQESKRANSVPPVFFLYHHAGYHELWDRADWDDPEAKRTFGEALRESVRRGYWDEAQARPGPEQEPRVLLLMAHNPLRRERSGRSRYVDHLFPKLSMLFAIETRMSSSAAFADIVLPAAWYYEKADLTLTFGLNPYTCLIEQAAEPPGEARPEWEIFAALAAKIAERAAARGLEGYRDGEGRSRRYADLPARFTMRGRLARQEDTVREIVRTGTLLGTFPPGTSFDTLRQTGQVRFAGLGNPHVTRAAASEVDPSRPFYSLAWHVRDKQVYPTFARRAQFYIDHEWFLEAGEALPTHKETPPIGGRHPFRLVSGHVRGSVHTLHSASPFFLRLHRGQPLLFVNDRVAATRGIADGETVRLFNDVDEVEIMVATSAAVGPDQVVVYMWEPFQFEGWKSHDALLVGMPKGLQLAGGYGQLVYHILTGTPSPSSERGLRVDIAKLSQRPRARPAARGNGGIA